ncbi:hypothetical protein, partial [Aeromonas enteropelogenes]|uniref:hypothetical protein n=1 Tax=Aeromonas enteropelogenes TaxID=29489 RepID=UPI003BA36671
RDTGKFYTGSLPINSGLEAWVWCDSNYPIPPIRSVLFFKDATINPATIYAGTTWARIATNQNIRGAADGEAGGTAGGSDIVALTTNELPPHIHGTEAHAHTGDNHAHHIFLGSDEDGGILGPDKRLAASHSSSGSGGSNTYSDYTIAPGAGSTEVGVTAPAAASTGAAAPNTLSAGSGAAFSVLNAFIKLHIWER